MTELSLLSLSELFHSDGKGGYELNSSINLTFSDPCFTEDFNEVIEALGITPEIDLGFSSLIGQGCQGATYTRPSEITWYTVSQRAKMVGNRLIIYGIYTIHHITIENGSTANFNAICGDVPISNGGGG